MQLYVCSVQYGVSLFASLCYFINGLKFTNMHFYVRFVVLYVGFLFCVLCVFVLFCVLFLLLYISVPFLFFYKFTDRCHRVETQLQYINIMCML
jgi:hypothetical protein